METDMHRVIRTQVLSDDHYSASIESPSLGRCHPSDLKPSNLLLNANCDLKETGFMTEYVATRWYRAPEIMLTFKQYTKAIDVWSVGCILGEMLSGRPLFPGRDYHHQLTLILDVLGTPSLDEFHAINSRRSRDYIRALPIRKKRAFASIYPKASVLAIDFLNKTLTFDPKKRLTVEQALQHPYLEAYHDPEDEPTAPPLDEDFFAFDRQKDEISKEELKQLLFDEIATFNSAGTNPNGPPSTSDIASTSNLTHAPAVKPKPTSSRNAGEPRRVRFNVGTKYHVMDVIGEGAYGIVCSAIHRPTGQKVAIKKIVPFDHSMFCLRTLRELKLLKYFQEHNVSENIITIVDIIRPPSIEAFKEVYLIQELMETDMHRVIRTQVLSDDHCQYFIYQTLRALKALHSADVIHRDLKPSNLLLNANCDLKVCDFGLARSIRTAEEETGFMTEYVATRWYRAPEIMLTFKQYTKAIDVWSVGCILGEMLSGRPLFPGRDYHHQLTLILDVLGTPSLDEFYAINSRRSQDYIRSLPLRKKRAFASIYPNASALAVDFLNKTLTFDPKKRLTVEQALQHPYLEAYHDPEDEPTAPPLDEDFFAFDRQKDEITKEELKQLLFDEVNSFHTTT
ncbi:hypothetical protein PSTT_04199, partial [Puccinia striiformis]